MSRDHGFAPSYTGVAPRVKVTLWENILATKLEQRRVKFERQYRVGPFIVDFFVYPNLVVEAEGLSHSGTQNRDRTRTAFLESLGLSVFRVSNNTIREDSNGVANMLREQQRIAASKYPTEMELSTQLVMESIHTSENGGSMVS